MSPWDRHEAAVERMLESSVGDDDDPNVALVRDTLRELRASVAAGLEGLCFDIARVQAEMDTLLDLSTPRDARRRRLARER